MHISYVTHKGMIITILQCGDDNICGSSRHHNFFHLHDHKEKLLSQLTEGRKYHG